MRPDWRSVSDTCARIACSAGMNEKNSIASVPSAAVARNSGTSTRMKAHPGMNRSTDAGIEARDRPRPIAVSGMATITARIDSSRPSSSVCENMRRRLAPSASRTAYSWLRSAPRAISRLAMFAQAISSSSSAERLPDRR